MSRRRIELSNFQTLNTGFPTEIKDNHFSDTVNMIRRRDGLWENRKGIKQFGEDVGSGLAVHSIRFWKTSAGSRYLTVGSDDDVYSYAEAADYNDGAYTARQDIGGSDKWDSIVYRDTLVIGNGTDDLRSSADNATFTQRAPAANIVQAKYLEVGNDFVSFAGVTGDPDKVLLSSGAPANPWEYNSSNVANIDIGNADQITGIKSLGDILFVAKNRQSYSVALSDFSRSTLDWGGGCESNRAILRTQVNSLFVAGRQGIFDISKTQIGNNQLFGSPESELIDSLYGLATSYSDINGIYTFDNNYAIWNVPTELGRLTFVRQLDYSDPVWTYFTGVNAQDWTIYEDANGGYHYLFADAATDKVWELFKGRNDNGAPILSRLATKRTDLGKAGIYKRIHFVEVAGYITKNAEWSLKIYRDDELDPSLTVTIDKDNLTTSESIDGLGVNPLGERPLGALVNQIDDLEVFPFFARVDIEDDYEKIQIVLENNQKDSRVILRKIVAEYTEQPSSFLDDNNRL